MFSIDKSAVYNKYKGCCAYCGTRISLDEMQVDVFLPIAKGGDTSLANLMPACNECFALKQGRTIQEFREALFRLAYKYELTEILYHLPYTVIPSFRFEHI